MTSERTSAPAPGGALWAAPSFAPARAARAPLPPPIDFRGFFLATEQYRAQGARRWPDSTHRDDELLWSSSGTVTVEADGLLWTVPAGYGLWVPAGVTHTIRASSESLLCGTFVAACTDHAMPATVSGVFVPVAARELLLLNADASAEMPVEVRRRLQRVVIDLVHPVPTETLDIRLPRSPELRAIAEGIIADPADARSTEAWAQRAGVNARRLAAEFREETGWSLTGWRIRARVRAALVPLGAGQPVTAVSRSLGYASPSTFIDHFRAVTGSTPAAFLRRDGTGGGTGRPRGERAPGLDG